MEDEHAGRGGLGSADTGRGGAGAGVDAAARAPARRVGTAALSGDAAGAVVRPRRRGAIARLARAAPAARGGLMRETILEHKMVLPPGGGKGADGVRVAAPP